jgi:uncharacterized protein
MNDESHQLVRERLSDAAAYAEGGPVEVRETHISVVFLTPTHAWKLLKPVKFDFLDFSTREARYAECWNEVRLNRRLAGDVYLDVVPVTTNNGDFALGGGGTPVEWVIKMRRLPDDATLEGKIRTGAASAADLDRVLGVLQPFFESAETGPAIEEGGRVAVVHRNLVENLDVLDRHAEGWPGLERSETPATAADVAVLKSMQLQFLATQRPLFDRRVAGGWVRDVHGDLRAEHVYLTDPVRIVDCVAFNNRFRHVDLLDEICFLATDLKRLGRDDLAAEIIDRYRQRMNDPAPDALAGFFQSYRFAVRAKVACLRAENSGKSTELRDFQNPRVLSSQGDAAALLGQAVEVLRPFHRPCVVAFSGVSGCGKSTIARELAAEIGGVHLASDVVRKELHGIDAADHSSAPELYSRETTADTYQSLRERAANWLDRGATVLLDATYRRADDRAAVRELARNRHVPFLLVSCQCSPEAAERRIQHRRQTGRDPSDADLAVLHRQRQEFEPPQEVPANERLDLSTEQPVGESCRQIVSRVPVV